MKAAALVAGASLLAATAPGSDPKFEGPGRFCAYAAIINLEDGETIDRIQGGIHGGSFVWKGSFGELEVSALGWAAEPQSVRLLEDNAKGYARLKPLKVKGKTWVGLWNHRNGLVSFSSATPLSDEQRTAIERVELFDEWDEPEGCDFSISFDW